MLHLQGHIDATGSLDNSVRIWDLRKRGALYCIAGHLKLVSHVQFDPIGGHYLLTASYDRTCKLWNTLTWHLAACLAGHAGVVMAADIAGDGSGTVVTTGYDKGIKLWRPRPEVDEDAGEQGTMEE
jgi:WD40 repeat protein